ncbi:MAG: hypothetical protein JXA96_00870 [Sedimentisphaerales bacterium]|nr:hypothetical protein [Sedimentisphaerales bacterium]
MKTQNTEHRIQEIMRRMGFSPCCIALCAITIFLLSGCGNNIIKPLPVCPGKANVTESLAAIQSQSENMIPLFTNKGDFSIELYNYDKDELQKQHLNIRILLIKPPSEIYVQGNAGIIDKAMVLGSNAKDFWIKVKPDPINSYWWGQWSDQDEDAGIMINPKTMLEALGITEIDTDANWSLANEGAYDVLTKKEQGIITKKLYIYCCDYRVKKIEYNDRYGKPIVLAKLDKYKEVSPGFFIPFSIKINSLSKNIEDTFNIEINLDTINPATEKQADYKIDRPKTPSVDHVYQIINGEGIEQ